MRRRKLRLGRAFALMLLGIVLGGFLWLGEHLRPDSLRQQVKRAVADLLAEGADFELEDVDFDLDTGVELQGLRLRASPGELPVVEAERVVLAVDHRKLLAGDIEILQVDVHGLVVRLRSNPERGGVPDLQGVFRTRRDERPTLPEALPRIRLHAGAPGSNRVEVRGADFLRRDEVVVLGCTGAEMQTTGSRTNLVAHFASSNLGSLRLELRLDPGARTLEAEAKLQGLRWRRSDFDLLEPGLRTAMPPVECGGVADGDARVLLDLGDLDVRKVSCEVRLAELEGAFGNVHTGGRRDLPFGLEKGTGVLRFEDGELSLQEFRADFVNVVGESGTLESEVHVDFRRVEPHVDFALRGRIPATTDGLRELLPPDVVESIVEQFLPSGTFDFDLTISQRPCTPEKVVAVLDLSDGRFDYAGRLDELTGKRFGFRYPLESATGRIRIETHVPTARGMADTITLRDVHGVNPIARPQGNGGPTHVAVVARGDIRMYDETGDVVREDVAIDIDVRDLPIDAKLAAAFASTPRGMPYKGFDLEGWADRVHIRVERDGWLDNEPRTTYDVTLRDCALAYEAFPLRIENVAGRILSRDYQPDPGDPRAWRLLEFQDLVGTARDGGRITGRGLVTQIDDGTEELLLTIRAEELRVGPDLDRALRESEVAEGGLLEVWDSLRPAGHLDVEVELRGPNDPKVTIEFKGRTSVAGFGDVEIPATGLEGAIVYDRGLVELREITGTLHRTPFHVKGTIGEDGALDLSGGLSGFVLDGPARELIGALAPEARATVDSLGLSPDSSLDVTLRAVRARSEAALLLTADLDTLDLRSRFMGLDLTIRGGPLRLDADRVTGTGLRLRSGDAEVRVLELDLSREQGRTGWAVMEARNLEPVGHLERVFGPGFKEILGENLRLDLQGFRTELNLADRTVILSGAVDLRRHRMPVEKAKVLEPTGALGLSPLTLRLPERPGDPVHFSGVVEYRGLNMNLPVDCRDMSGELRLADGTLGSEFTLKGAVFGGHVVLWDRVIDQLSLNLSFEPEYLRLGNVEGRFYQGNVRGDLEVHLGEPGAFKVRARATGVELGEMLAEDLPRDDPMSGTLDAALEVDSPGGEPQYMRGRGEIRVREGNLFRVPGLRRLLSVLRRATPLGGEGFKTAEADFTVDGEMFRVSRIHLATKLNDVHARGTVSIYGDLDLVVEPQVTRALDLPRLVNLPVLSTLRDLWHKAVYEIRMEGTIDSPALRLRGLPFLRKQRRPFTQSPHAGKAETMRPRLLP